MPGCSASNCCRRPNQGVRLFTFPRDPKRRSNWVKNCQRGQWQPTLHARLCEVHFEDSQFESRRADGWKKLKPNAVPTIFNVPNCPGLWKPKTKLPTEQTCISNEEDSLIIEQESLVIKEEFEVHEGLQHEDSSSNCTVKNESLDICEANDPSAVNPAMESDSTTEILQNTAAVSWHALVGAGNDCRVVDSCLLRLEVLGALQQTRPNASDLSNGNTVDASGFASKTKCNDTATVSATVSRILSRATKPKSCNGSLHTAAHILVTKSRPLFKSQKGGKMFMCSSLPQSPKQTHSEKMRFLCEICGKICRNLSIHKRRHTGERRSLCELCGKTFANNYCLTTHLRVHKGERPCECQLCGKTFRQTAALLMHVRVHTGERPFHCRICKKGFVHNGSLVEHERIHTGERPFECKVCGQAFGSSSLFARHKRMHAGVRPFQCKTCGKKFLTRWHLGEHEHCHSAERPFQCKQCGKTFKFSTMLSKHKRVHTQG